MLLALLGMAAQPLAAGSAQVSLEVPAGEHVEVSDARIENGKLKLTLNPASGAARVCSLTVAFGKQ
jgi:hypothetical protein